MLQFLWALSPQLTLANSSVASASFTNLVQTGERIEDGLKTGKIKVCQTLLDQSNGTGDSTEKNLSNQGTEKSEKEVHSIFRPSTPISIAYGYPTPVYLISALPPVFRMYANHAMYSLPTPCQSRGQN